jgi:cytidine deaminase
MTRKAKPKARAASPENARRLQRLIDLAVTAREQAYAPYSGYRVGAAIECASGKVFAGCNVENASYGATLCAERNAIAQMVAAGERDPVACAVVTEGAVPGSPCGICRQVLFEFANDMPVALVGLTPKPSGTGAPQRTRQDTTLAALLPLGFRFKR